MIGTTRESRALDLGVACAPMALLVAIHASRPLYLGHVDDAMQALYALDIVANGNWILPHAFGTVVPSAPPLYAWLSVAAAHALGGISEASCRAPGLVAALGVAVCAHRLARDRLGALAGVLAAWGVAVTMATLGTLLRADPHTLLALGIGLAALGLQRLDRGRTQGGAALAWLGLSVATLAAGAVGPPLVLAPVLVLAAAAPARARRLVAALRSRWACCALAPLGWLVLGVAVGGSPWLTEVFLPSATPSRELVIAACVLTLGAGLVSHTAVRRLDRIPEAAGLVAGGAAALAVAATLGQVLSEPPTPPDAREFAARVLGVDRAGVRTRILAGVPAPVYFHLRHRDAPLTVLELAAFDRVAPAPTGALLVCDESTRDALDQRWPTRFRVVLESEPSAATGRLSLLEDVRR